MKKHTKHTIRETNNTLIKPIINADYFTRLNVLNYARSEFRNEAQSLKPNNTESTDFTNIYNMSTAWDYVLKNINETITVSYICTINSIISQNNSETIRGGIFRNSFAMTLGQFAPNPEKISDLLDNAVFNMNSDKKQILTKAFDIHYDIITIQPFNDFNKRTARIIMNWFLLQNDYTPILFINKTDKSEYPNALRERLNGNPKIYTNYMCDRMTQTQHRILRILTQRMK